MQPEEMMEEWAVRAGSIPQLVRYFLISKLVDSVRNQLTVGPRLVMILVCGGL